MNDSMRRCARHNQILLPCQYCAVEQQRDEYQAESLRLAELLVESKAMLQRASDDAQEWSQIAQNRQHERDQALTRIAAVLNLIDNDRATPSHPVPFSRDDLKAAIHVILDQSSATAQACDEENHRYFREDNGYNFCPECGIPLTKGANSGN